MQQGFHIPFWSKQEKQIVVDVDTSVLDRDSVTEKSIIEQTQTALSLAGYERSFQSVKAKRIRMKLKSIFRINAGIRSAESLFNQFVAPKLKLTDIDFEGLPRGKQIDVYIKHIQEAGLQMSLKQAQSDVRKIAPDAADGYERELTEKENAEGRRIMENTAKGTSMAVMGQQLSQWIANQGTKVVVSSKKCMLFMESLPHKKRDPRRSYTPAEDDILKKLITDNPGPLPRLHTEAVSRMNDYADRNDLDRRTDRAIENRLEKLAKPIRDAKGEKKRVITTATAPQRFKKQKIVDAD